jgi:hypothetical protein
MYVYCNSRSYQKQTTSKSEKKIRVRSPEDKSYTKEKTSFQKERSNQPHAIQQSLGRNEGKE